MSGEEIAIPLAGITLAAKQWGNPSGPAIIALHGWLDNAASYDRLAPYLSQFRLVALDLPGHGRSAHRPTGTNYHYVDWVVDVLQVADYLGLDRFILMGHSLGGGIATLVAGTATTRVAQLVILDGLGPLTRSASETPEKLERAIVQRKQLFAAKPRRYPSIEQAAAVRAAQPESPITPIAAECLVSRGTELRQDGVYFRYDVRLRAPSLLMLSEEQVHHFLKRIGCPVMLVRPRDGWPFPEPLYAARIGQISDVEMVTVEGGHHVHLDYPERIVDPLLTFLSTKSG